MNKLTPEIALNNLYQAARLAKLTADEHAMIIESVKVLQALLPKVEPKEDKPAE